MANNDTVNKDRITKITDVIMRVARGDYSVQAEISGANDEIDSLALGINMMIDDLQTDTVRLEYVDKRLEEILTTVRELAAGNYTAACELTEKNDNFDALSAGINMMADDVKESHEALKRSEEKFKAQYKGIPVPTYTWQWKEVRKDFVLIDYNDAARRITGGDVADFVGITAAKMYGDRPDILDDLSTCFSEKSIMNKEMTVEYKKSGIFKHLSVTYAYVPPDLVMTHTEDITERKRAQEELIFKNTLLETQKESSPHGILVVDNKGKIISYNKLYIDMWAIPDEIIETKDRQKLQQYVSGQLVNPGEFEKKIECLYANEQETSRDEILFKDGRTFDRYSAPLNSPTGEHFGRIWFYRDITEMKHMQEKLLRQEKLAVLGQLAGGVGHEMRNPLGAIKNSVYFLNMVLEKTDPEIKETLNILEKEVTTSERIITSLLDFARVKPPLKRRVNIKEIIAETLSRIEIPGNIAVKNNITGPAVNLMADPQQLEQVFGNIILNAVQAMPDGGQLIINSDTPTADRLLISVTDTGVGIPAANLQKIFTPLFTSKAKGIGLGMAISKSFVEGHGGSIEVQSEEGKGATFTIQLPVGIT